MIRRQSERSSARSEWQRAQRGAARQSRAARRPSDVCHATRAPRPATRDTTPPSAPHDRHNILHCTTYCTHLSYPPGVSLNKYLVTRRTPTPDTPGAQRAPGWMRISQRSTASRIAR